MTLSALACNYFDEAKIKKLSSASDVWSTTEDGWSVGIVAYREQCLLWKGF
jgi:hypothetical protein